jgi:hypothetical protein
MIVTPEEAAYFAGFFDGEGSVGIYHVQNTIQTCFRVSLCNNIATPLQKAEAFFGGRLRPRYREYRGRPTCNWEWYVWGNNAVNFLETIYPFLSVKTEQVDVFLRAYKFCPPRGNHKGDPLVEENRQTLREAEMVLKDLKRGA